MEPGMHIALGDVSLEASILLGEVMSEGSELLFSCARETGSDLVGIFGPEAFFGAEGLEG